MASKDSYEEQLNEIIKIAENNFEKDYFDKLDEIISSFQEDESKLDFTLKINNKGAFYACEE